MKKFLYLGILLLLISCSIKDFEAPEFDKKITVPLTNEIYYMADLADTTDDYMIYVGNDSMMFSIEDEFDTEYVDEEDLKIDGQEDSFDTELGDELMLDSREETTEVGVGDNLILDSQEEVIERSLNQIEVEESGNAYAFIEILSFASEAINEPVEPIEDEIIPPFYDFEPFNQDFTLFENDNFEYVTIDTGSVYVNFFNNTQLPLSSNLGEDFQMHFEFYTNGTAEADDGTYIFTYYIDSIINPGELENIAIPFDGNTVFRNNYLKAFLTTDGSSGPIDVTYDDFFEVTFWVGNMTITEANAEIEEANMDENVGLPLEDNDIQIISAEIATCTGSIVIQNYLPLDIDSLSLQFEEVYTESDELLTINLTDILQNSETTIPLDFSGYSIVSTNEQPLDSLSVLFSATTIPPLGYTLINQNDMIISTIELGEMVLSQFTGIIDQINETEDFIDISEEDYTIVNAVIDECMMYVDFSGVDLSAPSTVEIYFDEIIDHGTSENLVVTIDNFDNIQIDLAGYEITLADDQILHYNTTVHLNQEITLSSNSVAVSDVLLEDLYFESVSGIFSGFEIEESGSTEVDSTGEFNLFFAEIHQCELHISIPAETYPIPFGAHLDLTFEDIYTPDGKLYSFSFECPGDTVIDLSGFTLGLDPTSENTIDSLYYSYVVVTEASDEVVTIYGDDTIEASITIDEIVFQEVSGIIDNRLVELDDITEDIDLDDLPDSLAGLLEFQAVELHLDVFNQTGFDCRLVMDITSSNDDGDEVSISVDETIFAESLTNIVLTDGVNEMLNIIPNQINITNMAAFVGDGISSGTISLNDSISGSYAIVSPMQFIVNDHFITKTTEGEELDGDDQDTIEDNLEAVKIVVEAENTLPFGMDISLFLANDSLEIFSNPGLVIDTLSLEPAQFNDGNTIPSTNQIIVDLSGDDFDVLLNRENPFIYPGVEIYIKGSNGEVVTILGTDNLKVTGYIEAVVHVSEGEDN